jgi:hypothetical protein
LDLVALVGVVVLIALGQLTPTEGLPWIALLVGSKAAKAVTKKGGGGGASGSGLLGMLGL